MSDVFVAAAQRSLRRSLFQRFKGMGLSQDQVTRAVATAAQSALKKANVADLATVAAAAPTLRAALAAVAPDDPALGLFDAATGGVSDRVRELLDREP